MNATQAKTALTISILLASCLLYIYLGYFIPRSNFYNLITCWTLLFAGSYYLIKYSNLSTSQLFYFAVAVRLLLLIATPILSQDFNRFIWDGRMLLKGFNPYLYTPENLIASNTAPIAQAKELYSAMGSLNASHYTNYPPISQLCYAIAGLFGSKSILISIIILRLELILADIGIFWIGKKLLTQLELPTKNLFLYLLNPFIIIELTGNLHFEAVMAFFVILSIYLLLKNKWIWSAIALGIAVSVKLIPLLFLPVFVLYFIKKPIYTKGISLYKNGVLLLHKRKEIATYLGFCVIVLLTNFFLFLPFLSNEFIQNFTKTISLWFQNFEFNASVYYIIRWIGYKVVGWNIIGSVGKILPLVIILLLFILSLIRKNFKPKALIESLLFAMCIYLMLSTTVHPWYLSIPLLLSALTKYKYVWVWTCTIILSYNAYAHPEFKENLLWIALEYSIVFGVFIYEILPRKRSIKI